MAGYSFKLDPVNQPSVTISKAQMSALVYPVTIWATPQGGGNVTVQTNIDGITNLDWPPGNPVAVASQSFLSAPPGAVTFTLSGGGSALCGIN